MKLIALYKTPDDPAAFDNAYFNTHLPLLKKVPGLQRTNIYRITRTMMGDEYHLMAAMTFADVDALKAALRSPEMAAAGENLDSFAKDMYTLMWGDPV